METTFWLRVGSEKTNAVDRMNRNPLILRQTTEKERFDEIDSSVSERVVVLQVVDLSVLAAVSFRIVRTLSLS